MSHDGGGFSGGHHGGFSGGHHTGSSGASHHHQHHHHHSVGTDGNPGAVFTGHAGRSGAEGNARAVVVFAVILALVGIGLLIANSG